MVLLAGDAGSYVSGLQIENWFFTSPYVEAYLTDDATAAAAMADGGLVQCVIVIGGAALSAIKSAASSAGYSLTSYSTFTAWQNSAGTQPGYIDAAGSSVLNSYTLALSASQSAAANGWA